MAPQLGQPVVAIAEAAGAAPGELLAQALEQGGLWRTALPRKDGGRAVLLLDFAHFERDSPVVVRREIVESLVDALADRGFREIALASSGDGSATWAENRDVLVLADLLGYSYRSARGTDYDIRDLADDLVEGGFPAGSVLAGSRLSRVWLEADLRIVVARCRTDQRNVFALAGETMLLALPQVDDFDSLRVDPGEALALLLDRAPPHFCIVDACGAAHGSGGRQAPLPIATNAVIAGADLLSVDCAAAAKMGADPGSSRVLARVLASAGVPRSRISGDGTTFAGMKLPDPLLVAATGARDRSPFVARLVAPWLQRCDPRLFPFKNAADGRINAWIAPRLDRLDDDPAARMWLIAASHLMARADAGMNAWRTVADKDAVPRRVAGVTPATLERKEEDYLAMERELLALVEWLHAHTPARRPLRWRSLAGAVVFEYSRDFPVPFEEFVGRVDVARTIQFMNDYLGGAIVPVRRDEAGRPVRQVERNLYLPQPNYLAWWGGQEIDVSKIESVQYQPGLHRLFWKTIESANGSAQSDDGIATFEAAGEATRVTIFGRQLFTLPPFWKWVDLDRYPEIKGALVEHAYETFFSRTFSNFEALLEGRAVAIGRPGREPATAADGAPRPIDSLARAAKWLGEAARPWVDALARSAAPARGPAGPSVDALGYAHLEPVPAAANGKQAAPIDGWTDLLRGSAEALARDLEAAVASRPESPGETA